jgi:hypothetical protein
MAEISEEYQQTRVMAIISKAPRILVALNLKKRTSKAAITP